MLGDGARTLLAQAAASVGPRTARRRAAYAAVPVPSDLCPECGHPLHEPAVAAVPRQLAELAARYRRVLLAPGPDERLRRRPAPDVWSPLEYAGHVRDVLLVQRDRVVRALVEEVPQVVTMHGDQRVDLLAYNDAAPDELAEELEVAARLFGALVARLDDAQLARRCTYNYPAPAERDLTWVAWHTLHEVRHHLHDVERQLADPNATVTPPRGRRRGGGDDER